MRNFILLYFLVFCIGVYANDGAFYMAGNQLVPINETDISVKKEILYIKKTQEFAEVSVYYEFFNPKETKEIIVGFEAGRPSGDELLSMDIILICLILRYRLTVTFYLIK